MKPEIQKEQKEIVDNFDRLRRSILRHKEANKNLGENNVSQNNEDKEAEKHNLYHSKSQHRGNFKMYSAASMEFK